MLDMPICEGCGVSYNEKDFNFCPFCGREQPNSSQQGAFIVHCKSCNGVIPSASTYCLHCGTIQSEEIQSINTNPPVYIDNVSLWPSGPRHVIDGGWTKNTQVGRWLNWSFTLKDKQDHYTACNGDLIIAVLKKNATLPCESPVEKILSELEKKSYFVHKYDFEIKNFKIIDNKLTAAFLNTSQIVYCDQARGDSTLFFHFLVKPVDMDWIVWRPSYSEGWTYRYPRSINWD